MGNYKTVTVDVDIELDSFDDDDIREEYISRFGVGGGGGDWSQIYEKRRSLSRENFLAWLDIIIQNKTGRIL
jgi:hypothetical protein